MLGRGPLVLGSVLLDTTVLGRLVLLTAGVSTLGALNVGVGAVTACQRVWVGRKDEVDLRSTETVLGGDSLVGSSVLLKTVVLQVSVVL